MVRSGKTDLARWGVSKVAGQWYATALMRSNGAEVPGGGGSTRIGATVLAIFLLIGAAGCAGTRPPDPDAWDLFDQSHGLWAIAALVSRLDEMADAAAETLSAEESIRLREALPGVSDLFFLHGVAIETIASDWRPAAAAEVVRFFSSPVGRRILAVEKMSFVDQDPDALSHYVDVLMQRPVPVERVALLDRLAGAQHAAEMQADLEVGAMRILLYALQALQPADRRWQRETIAAEVERRRGNEIASFERMQTVLFQYAYRDLSDEDIERYVAFAESDAGRWQIATHRRAMGMVMDAIRAGVVERLTGDGTGYALSPSSRRRVSAPALRGFAASPS